jgi:hypothetical protein
VSDWAKPAGVEPKMNWELHKEKLIQGETVQFRPKGNSMNPKIKSGDLITVEPVEEDDIEKGDILFCRVKGNHYVHLVMAVQSKMGQPYSKGGGGGKRFQIGNNKGRINGWIGFQAVFGRVRVPRVPATGSTFRTSRK